MRAILFILILIVVGLLIAIGTGFLDIRQTQMAQAPAVSVDGAKVTAKGGKPPAFDVETGSVGVGRKSTNVAVPTLQVNPPAEPQQAADNMVNTAQ